MTSTKSNFISGIGAVWKLKETIINKLNKLVQDYCETSEVSQLSVSLWAGDVVLHDLRLKTTAVETLGQLPIKVVAGKIGVLAIKIPWATIFSNPVEVTIKDFYVILNPSYKVYDRETEEQISLILKKSLVKKIEDRYKEYLIKQNTGGTKSADSYLHKCGVQIARNMQIKLESFHLRYEDNKITKPSHAFSFGLILNKFSVQTTDTEWTPSYISKQSFTLYKLGTIEGLAVYWNIKTALISKNPRANKEDLLKKLEEMRNGKISKFKYVISPISAVIKVLLTPHPQKVDFTFPTFSIDAVLNELGLEISNLQLRDLFTLAETLEYVARNQRYKKHKPRSLKTFNKNYKKWWLFAYECIIEEIRRQNTNWSWPRIKAHCQARKNYIELYYKKLTSKTPSEELEGQINELELNLDVFNLILCRKLVQLRLGRLQKIESAKKPGWFSSWFTSYTLTADDMSQILSENWTAEEKSQLKDAIDYRDDNDDEKIEYPQDYESIKINFHVKTMNFILSKLSENSVKNTKTTANISINKNPDPDFGVDDPVPSDQSQSQSRKSSSKSTPNLSQVLEDVETQKSRFKSKTSSNDEILDRKPYHTIVRLIFLDFKVQVATRPVRSALKLSINLKKIEARGFMEQSQIIVSTTSEKVTNFFELVIETMPLDSEAEKRVKLSAQRLQLNYNWKSYAEIIDLLTFPTKIELHELHAVAVSKLEEFKEYSSSSFQQFIINKTEVEIIVDLVAPYIVLPQNGALDKNSNYLVLDFGELHLRSHPKVVNVAYQTPLHGLSFDTYTIDLKEFRVFLFLPAETKKKNYLLKYKQLNLTVKFSMLENEKGKSKPTIKVDADLPTVDASFSQRNLCRLLNLIVTLPLPRSFTNPSKTTEPSRSVLLSETKAISRLPYIDFDEENPERSFKYGDVSQHPKISMSLRIKTVRIIANQSTGNGLLVEIVTVNLSMKSKMFVNEFDADASGMRLILLKGPNTPARYLIKTLSTGKPLMTVQFSNANSACPKKLLPSCATTLIMNITRLDIIMYQDAVSTVWLFIDGFINMDFRTSVDLVVQLTKKRKKPRKTSTTVKSRVVVTITTITIQLCSDECNIMRFQLRQMNLSVEEVIKVIVVSLTFSEVAAFSTNSKSLYRKLLTVSGPKIVDFALTHYKTADAGEKKNIKIHLVVGTIRLVLLPSFISFLMNISIQIKKDQTICRNATQESPEEKERSHIQQEQQQRYRIYSIKQAPTKERKYFMNDRKLILNISIEPPTLTFPEESNSANAIRVNLGRLNVKNNFVDKPLDHPEKKALIDTIDFNLTESRVSRVFIDLKTEKMISQAFLLNPISFSCKIERNLSKFCPEIPKLIVNGNFENNLIRLSKEDFKIVSVVLGHFKKNGKSQSESPQVGTNDSTTLENDQNEENDDDESSNALSSTKIPDILKQEKLKLNVLLEKSEIILYNGTMSLEKKTGVIEHQENDKLAKFSLNDIKLKCTIWKNGDIIIELTVDDVILQDSRKGQDTNIFLRNVPTAPHFLTVTFKNGSMRKPDESNLNMEIPGLSLNIFSEFVTELLKFFNNDNK